LLEGDVVLVMSDVPNGKALGKCYLIDENNRYSLNQRICAIRSKSFNSKFLYYQLNRNGYFLSFDNGENQTNLRKSDILECPVIVPPINIQEKIVKILDFIKNNTNQVIENTHRKSIIAEELQQSLLRLPFNGKQE
jgi:restriction endonuclease S subunit